MCLLLLNTRAALLLSVGLHVAFVVWLWVAPRANSPVVEPEPPEVMVIALPPPKPTPPPNAAAPPPPPTAFVSAPEPAADGRAYLDAPPAPSAQEWAQAATYTC